LSRRPAMEPLLVRRECHDTIDIAMQTILNYEESLLVSTECNSETASQRKPPLID
jgi:hypothetical protein